MRYVFATFSSGVGRIEKDHDYICSTIKSIVSNNLDEVVFYNLKNFYSDEQIEALFNTKVLEKYCEENDIPCIKEWLHIDCFRWKPRLILKCLNEMKNGDILFYHDCDFISYPIYLKNFDLTKNKINKMLGQNSIVLFYDSYKPLLSDCKNTLLQEFGLEGRQKYANGIWASPLLIRNSQASRDFVKRWLDCCSIDNTYPLSLSKQSQYSIHFKRHSCEQAVLSCMITSRSFSDKKSLKIRLKHARNRLINNSFKLSDTLSNTKIFIASHFNILLNAYIFR